MRSRRTGCLSRGPRTRRRARSRRADAMPLPHASARRGLCQPGPARARRMHRRDEHGAARRLRRRAQQTMRDAIYLEATFIGPRCTNCTWLYSQGVCGEREGESRALARARALALCLAVSLSLAHSLHLQTFGCLSRMAMSSSPSPSPRGEPSSSHSAAALSLARSLSLLCVLCRPRMALYSYSQCAASYRHDVFSILSVLLVCVCCGGRTMWSELLSSSSPTYACDAVHEQLCIRFPQTCYFRAITL